MNEGCDDTAKWTGGKKMHWFLFFILFWRGTVDCRYMVFVGQINKELAWIFLKKQWWKLKCQEIPDRRIKKGRQMKCVYWLCKRSFQYFNHPRWDDRGDGRCYITRSPLLLFFYLFILFYFFGSLCFFDISLLNYISKRSLTVEAYTMITCCFQKKKEKSGSHLSRSHFECSANNNVILNTQFSIS